MGAVRKAPDLVMDVQRCSDFHSAFTIAAAFLSFNTLVAIVRMREDIVAVTFAISFFVFMMIFFWFLTLWDKLPGDSKKEQRLKIPVWALATSLNLMIAYRVCTHIQPGMVLVGLVWGMAVTTSAITFYFFFVYGKKKSKKRSVSRWMATACLRIASSCHGFKFRTCSRMGI